MKRNVLYFIDSVTFGGAEQALITLIASLDRQHWQPVLIHHESPGIAPLLGRAHALGVPCHVVPAMPEGIAGACKLPSMVHTLRQMQADVFHAHLTWQRSCKYGLLAAALARIPAIVATVQLLVNLPESRVERIKQRIFTAGVGRYIAVSHDQVHCMRATCGIEAERIDVVPNAVSFALQHNQSVVPARLTSSGQSLVLTLARLHQQKGLDVLIQAAALIPNALFAIAGDGPERAALEAQVQAFGLTNRVLFLGYREDVPELLAGCDLFVLPSRYEGLPLAVLEAMAAARPVITTAIDGTREAIVHGESGILVPPDNPRALAGAVQMLLASPVLAQRLANAGRERVMQQFTPEVMVQRVTEVYDQLLARHGGDHDCG